MKNALASSVRASGAIIRKANRRREYGIVFWLNGVKTDDLSSVNPGDIVKAIYVGGNAVDQAPQMEALGLATAGRVGTEVQLT